MKNSSAVYISNELRNKLNNISEYGLNYVVAPSGYGKTTAIKEYGKSIKTGFKWIDVTCDSKNIFWEDFCDVLFGDNSDVMKAMGYPDSPDKLGILRSEVKKLSFDETAFFVLDNYHLVGDADMDMVFASMLNVLPDCVHIVIISRKIYANTISELIQSGMAGMITRDDLCLSCDDIISMFGDYGYNISRSAALQIEDNCGGWISAVLLFLNHYAKTRVISNDFSIDSLISRTKWMFKTPEEQKLILILSKLSEFNYNEAQKCCPKEHSIDVLNLLRNEEFFTYRYTDRSYSIIKIYDKFLLNEYNQLDDNLKKEIAVKAADILYERKDFFGGYKLLSEVGVWEKIYTSRPAYKYLYPYAKTRNHDFFVQIAMNCPDVIDESTFSFSIVLCLMLYMFYERQLLINLIMNIVYSIEENEKLSDKEKNNSLGLIFFIRGYTELNNRPVMSQFFNKAIEYAELPFKSFKLDVPTALGLPSVIFALHRDDENADDEISDINEMISNYYKLSGFHSCGIDALFEAEVLFYRGEIQQSEILCHKALFMANSREQLSIKIATEFLLIRIGILVDGSSEYEANRRRLNLYSQADTSCVSEEYKYMVELCEAYLDVTVEDRKDIVKWLTDYNLFMEMLNFGTSGFAQVIYAKYLFLSGEYEALIGICGQLAGMDSYLNMSMKKLYLYIYIAMAYSAINDGKKAQEVLTKAFDYAKKDFFVIPFIENYEYVEEIIKAGDFSPEYNLIIRKIRKTAENYVRRFRAIKKNMISKANVGLTKRELDIARLAARKFTNGAIALELSISVNTVKSALKSIFSKLGISNRNELAKIITDD